MTGKLENADIAIRLNISQYGNGVELAVEFINISEHSFLFGFSDIDGNASYYYLSMRDEYGKQIAPTGISLLTPRTRFVAPVMLEPGSSYFFKLKGYLDHQNIVFRGCQYPFHSARAYTFQFSKNGLISNEVKWVAP